MVETDLVDENAGRVDVEELRKAPLEADGDVAEPDGAMTGVEQGARDDPHGVGEVDGPEAGRGSRARPFRDLEHHGHRPQRLAEAARTGRLLTDAAACQRDRLVGEPRLLPADADLHEHEVRAVERPVEIGCDDELARVALAVEHALRQPADDLAALLVDVL